MDFKSTVNITEKSKSYLNILILLGLFMLTTHVYAQDPNFYIYICFGQSNMEGQGTIENIDNTVDSRFRVMQAVECSNLGRIKGSWYTAIPPLCRCYSGLCPADYFGKTMVLNLPDSIRVGVVNVSVAGCKIELFDKDNYQDYVSTITEDWLLNIINEYNGNPYGYLVEMAQLAQQDGVIKGILLHQGESNTGDTAWPSKVKKIYNDLITDLDLDAETTPLLAGEVVNADQGGVCASMNSIIAVLPDTLPNSYVISSSGCTDQADNLHFDSAGYREIGKRYAVQMLSLMGYDTTSLKYPEIPVVPEGNESHYLEPECAIIGDSWEILTDAQASNGKYVTVTPGVQSLNAPAADSAGAIYFTFSVDTPGNFNVFARLNCLSYDDDSFWIRADNGEWVYANGLVTSGWQWLKLNNYELSEGEHTITMTYREDGAKLDKICISDNTVAPTGMGKEAENICVETGVKNSEKAPDAYQLGQNFPNPFNPETSVIYYLPQKSRVILKIYDITGREIRTLKNEWQGAGEHSVKINSQNMTSGIYFYRLQIGKIVKQKKMILLK